MLLGYQAVYDEDFFSAIDYAQAHRFDYVSFDLNVPRFYLDYMTTDALDRLRRYAEDHRVGLAFHAPGDNISLYADYPAIRQGILAHMTSIITAAERLNARHVTIHPGTPPSLKQVKAQEDAFLDEYRTYFGNILYENLLHLTAATRRVRLCVENYNFTSLTRQIVSRLLSANAQLALTWDLAKTYRPDGQPDKAVEAFMWQHINHVHEIHAHDFIPGFRSHQPIGDGVLDFTSYTALFTTADIAVTIEIRPREAATESRDRLLAVLDDG